MGPRSDRAQSRLDHHYLRRPDGARGSLVASLFKSLKLNIMIQMMNCQMRQAFGMYQYPHVRRPNVMALSDLVRVEAPNEIVQP
jgi:hypothetical protein